MKMSRVLLVAATTGYQLRSFTAAAEQLGVDLLIATDRCHILKDPWQDSAIPIRFYEKDRSVDAIKSASLDYPLNGVLAVGDKPAVIAAAAAQALQLFGHSIESVTLAANKLLTRLRLREVGLPSPWFRSVALDVAAESVIDDITFPCVVKPLAMSGSKGVIRANTSNELIKAIRCVQRLLRLSDVQMMQDPANLVLLVEKYISGIEVAIEGVMIRGELHILAIFDKPNPLTGPFFEETIYVTPTVLSDIDVSRISETLSCAVAALGLSHGPVHAECRVNDSGVFVLEVAARSIGGLCSLTLRFDGPNAAGISLEELLLRHAVGEDVTLYQREEMVAGVMMIPIPIEGLYKGVVGLNEARAVKNVEEIIITAKQDQHIKPPPEGDSYLGFIFARAPSYDDVVIALRAANERLKFHFDANIPLVEQV